MKPGPTQGAQAGSTGRTLESIVHGVLIGKGFTAVSYRDYQLDPERYGLELLLTNVPYASIYGHAGKSEFVVRSARYQLNLRIECKWQQAAGSVDEKFPYAYLNAIEVPENDVFIIVDGGGAKAGSIAWLRQVAAERRYLAPDSAKRIEVLNITEFVAWANRLLR